MQNPGRFRQPSRRPRIRPRSRFGHLPIGPQEHIIDRHLGRGQHRPIRRPDLRCRPDGDGSGDPSPTNAYTPAIMSPSEVPGPGSCACGALESAGTAMVGAPRVSDVAFGRWGCVRGDRGCSGTGANGKRYANPLRRNATEPPGGATGLTGRPPTAGRWLRTEEPRPLIEGK